MWDVETGEPFAPPFRDPIRVFWSWFNPDGQSVISAADCVRLWRLHTTDASLEVLRSRAELYAAERRDARLGIVPLTRAELRERWEAALGK